MFHLLLPKEIFIKSPDGCQGAIHRIGRKPFSLKRRQKRDQLFRPDPADPAAPPFADNPRIPAQIPAVPVDGVAGGPLFDRQVVEILIDQMMHVIF
jgi:hypothetical protein